MNPAIQMNVVELSAALAADLAAEIYPQDEVFRIHGLEPETGEELLLQPWFRAMVDQAKRDWSEIGNSRERIRIKAQITLEQSLPTMYALLSDKNVPAAARVAAFKEVKEIAGMAAKEAGEAPPSFIPIQIFLDGREKPPMVINAGYTQSSKALPEPEELGDETDEVEGPDTLKPEGISFGMLEI